jgi:hypothetical protein
MFNNNGIPFVQSADNLFYSNQRPVYSNRVIMKGSTDAADNSESNGRKRFVLMKVFYINMSYLNVTSGFLRFLLIVSTKLYIFGLI